MASSSEETKTEVTIYSMPGSQFTGKVLAALDARKIPHYSVFVPIPLEQRRQFLPSGGTLVPEMKAVVGDKEPVIVADSEAILKWFDDSPFETKFFPTEQASELSVRASEKIIAGAVWYFNWVDDEGYNRSMKRSMAKALLPAFFPEAVSGFIVNLFIQMKAVRPKYRNLALGALGVDDATLEDREKIRSMLVEELKFFQSLLKTPDQKYLLGDESTAPDFSVYAQVGLPNLIDLFFFAMVNSLSSFLSFW